MTKWMRLSEIIPRTLNHPLSGVPKAAGVVVCFKLEGGPLVSGVLNLRAQCAKLRSTEKYSEIKIKVTSQYPWLAEKLQRRIGTGRMRWAAKGEVKLVEPRRFVSKFAALRALLREPIKRQVKIKRARHLMVDTVDFPSTSPEELARLLSVELKQQKRPEPDIEELIKLLSEL